MYYNFIINLTQIHYINAHIHGLRHTYAKEDIKHEFKKAYLKNRLISRDIANILNLPNSIYCRPGALQG